MKVGCKGVFISRTRLHDEIMRHIEFDRVHRLGRYKRGQTYPRPIVAKFTYYKDKEFVRHAAPKTLIGTNISVNEQFPSEIEQRRKVLYPVAKKCAAKPRQQSSTRARQTVYKRPTIHLGSKPEHYPTTIKSSPKLSP